MILLSPRGCLHKLPWLLAAFGVVTGLRMGVARAEHSVVAEIQAAIDSSQESSQALETSIAREKASLEKLAQLHSKRQATWREVAEQHVTVASLEAKRKAAREFADFVVALRESAENARDDISQSGQSYCTDLRIAALRLNAALAQAGGELRAAEISLRREQQRLAAKERLFAAGFASALEIKQARHNRQAAAELVEKLAFERAARREAYEALVGCSGDSAIREPIEKLEMDDVRPESLPSRMFSHSAGLGKLLRLRQSRCAAVASGATIGAQRQMCEELMLRLTASQKRGAHMECEIEQAFLDVELLKARQVDASERVTILRLAEKCLVAQCLEEPSAVSIVTALSPEFAGLTATALLGEAQRLSAVPERASHAAPTPPSRLRESNIIDWIISGRNPREISRATYFPGSRSPEPIYFDYYQSGIRRTDLPHQVREQFAPGSIPWYLPGSPTNFR